MGVQGLYVSVYDSVDGPKLRDLSKILKKDESEALGILTFLWLWALKNGNADSSGHILKADEQDIAKALQCKTDVPMEDVLSALFEIGWLDHVDGEIYLHDWSFWQAPWYKYQAKLENDRKRYVNAEKQLPKLQDVPKSNASESPKKPIKKNSVTDTIKNDTYPEDFLEFWKAYPRHDDKGAAYKCYHARIAEKWKPEDLLEAAKNYAAKCIRDKTGKEYIKQGATFLGPSMSFKQYIYPKKKETELQENPFAEYGDT